MPPSQLLPAIPIDPENIPEDLVCAICLGLPTKPVLTPCEHVFCSDCIHQSLARRHQCPIDRCEVTPNQISLLRKGSLLWRIWAGTKVKCANHTKGCAWTGQISEYEPHALACAHTEGCNKRERKRERIRLRVANQQKDDEIASLKASVEDLTIELTATVEYWKHKNEDLKRKNEEAAVLFTGLYEYNPQTIPDLRRLITNHFNGCPGYIDEEKVFGCVEKCYHIFRRIDFSNKPKGDFYYNVRSLVEACQTSSFFGGCSKKDSIYVWVREQGWDKPETLSL